MTRALLLRIAVTVVVACGIAGCNHQSPTSPTPPSGPTTPPVQPPPPPPPPPPPTLKYTKFMAFGDSMTEGTISPAPMLMIKLDASQAYPALLEGLLAGRYTAQTPTVVNRGKGGEWAVQGLPRFIDALGTDQPEVALVLEGFNDIVALSEHGITPAINALDQMVKEGRARNCLVILATLPPERPGGRLYLYPQWYDEFNAQLVQTAQNESVPYIDLSHELDLSAIGADGVHPTEQGYQQMAQIYFTHIQGLFEQGPQPTASKAHAAAAHAGTR